MGKLNLVQKVGLLGVCFFMLLVGLKVVIGNSNSPVASKTGAPNENKCIQCHGGTAGTGSVSMVFGNNETQYVPGQQYTIQVSTIDPTKVQFGFQITALAGGIGATVGVFAVTNTANTTTQTGTVTGFLRKYVSHRAANSTQNWTFNWTAPPTDIGPITFFLVGVGANDNNSDTGDKVYSTTFTITATPPPPPVASFTATDTNICEATSVQFTDQSTNSPSTYSWIFAGGTPSNSNLSNPTVVYAAPGSYDVTLIVGNVSGSDTLFFPNHIVVNAAPQLGSIPNSASCFGGNDGAINLTASGAAPFSYAWSNGVTIEDPSGLAAGAYSVTVTDANGCFSTATYTVNEPTQITLAFSTQSANCGQSNGSATSIPTGGVGPYTYLWSNLDTLATATGLNAGTFDVTVTDANGCQMVGSVGVSNLGAPSGSSAVTDVTCSGDQDGAVDLTIAGGVGPFTYQWSTGASTEDISGLAAGSYSVTVTSSDGCVLSQVITVEEPALLLTTVSSTPEMAGNDGSATVTPTGGNGGYSYLWSNGETSATISNLAAGTYSVTVTDSLGCSTSTNVNVSLIISVAGSVVKDPFTVGPNPFNEFIQLTPTISTYGKFIVHLVDIKGRIVYANEIYAKGSSPIRLEPGTLPTGIYLLKVHTAKGDMIRKLMHTNF